MKTKAQKKEDLKEAEALLKNSNALLFADFAGIPTKDLRNLRTALRDAKAKLVVVKKRLLNVLFKEKGIPADATKFPGSVATIFSEKGLEDASGTLYKFFVGLPETETKKKADNAKRLLGGYDLAGSAEVTAETALMIGKLPPREALLGQLLGMLAAPIRSLLYVLQEKSKKS